MIIRAIVCDGYPETDACDRMGAPEIVPGSNASLFRLKLQRQGWLYVANEGRDFCPACHERRKADKAKKTKTESASQLHRRRAHPDYEYATTTDPRKAFYAEPPDGDGWERNVDEGRNGWERFDYHEEAYWRRRKIRKKDAGKT